MRDMGIERVLLGAIPSTRDQLIQMERFRDDVMAQF